MPVVIGHRDRIVAEDLLQALCWELLFDRPRGEEVPQLVETVLRAARAVDDAEPDLRRPVMVIPLTIDTQLSVMVLSS
jgi:hypothetical protein